MPGKRCDFPLVRCELLLFIAVFGSFVDFFCQSDSHINLHYTTLNILGILKYAITCHASRPVQMCEVSVPATFITKALMRVSRFIGTKHEVRCFDPYHMHEVRCFDLYHMHVICFKLYHMHEMRCFDLYNMHVATYSLSYVVFAHIFSLLGLLIVQHFSKLKM